MCLSCLVCLCLGMVWAWLVGYLGFGLGSWELWFGLGLTFPFNKLGELPFIVGLMAGLGHGWLGLVGLLWVWFGHGWLDGWVVVWAPIEVAVRFGLENP